MARTPKQHRRPWTVQEDRQIKSMAKQQGAGSYARRRAAARHPGGRLVARAAQAGAQDFPGRPQSDSRRCFWESDSDQAPAQSVLGRADLLA
jgi:hypothetical protein